MLKEGNGAPDVCVQNILRTVRYEVPYERIKGLPADIIDQPISTVHDELVEEMRDMIETYEPRVSYSAAGLIAETAARMGAVEAGVDIALIIDEDESEEEAQ